MWRSSGRAARCAGVFRSPHSALQSTNGDVARGGRRGRRRAARRGPPSRRRPPRSARRRPGVDLALARRGGRARRGPRARGRVVRAPAEQRELERHALVQRGERAGAVGRHVVGHEEDRSSQRVLVGGDRRAPADLPREARLDGLARRRAELLQVGGRPAARRSRGERLDVGGRRPAASRRRRATISSGPGSPRAPIAGRPPAIAST